MKKTKNKPETLKFIVWKLISAKRKKKREVVGEVIIFLSKSCNTNVKNLLYM